MSSPTFFPRISGHCNKVVHVFVREAINILNSVGFIQFWPLNETKCFDFFVW